MLQRRRALRSWILVASVAVLGFPPDGAHAQVSCADPDNLCTGDPCTINGTEVASPCVVDFGSRTVIVRGPIRVPNGGLLDFTAGEIQVRNGIFGRHMTPSAGDGADVALTSTGDMLIRGTIDVTGRATAGSIVLDAGGNLTIDRRLRAASAGGGATAPGGAVVAGSGGTLATTSQGRIDVRGARFGRDTPGGSVSLTATTMISQDARILARGLGAGSVALTAGAVDVLDQMDVRGGDGAGGSLSIQASGLLNMTKAPRLDADLGGASAQITVGSANILKGLRARSKQNGSQVTIASVGDVALRGSVDVGAKLIGGLIVVTSSAGGIDSDARFSARADTGGLVALGAAGALGLRRSIDVRGRATGGLVNLTGAAVSLGSGGDLSARGDIGGSISVVGDSLTVDRGTRMEVRGSDAGGEIRMKTLAGNMVLAGRYDATGPGPAPASVIEGISAADLTTPDGMFETDPGGCLGFSAAGTLDLSGGTFSGPAITPSCASPSGAFVDGFEVF